MNCSFDANICDDMYKNRYRFNEQTIRIPFSCDIVVAELSPPYTLIIINTLSKEETYTTLIVRTSAEHWYIITHNKTT